MSRRWRANIAALLLFALTAALLLNKSLLPGYTLLPLDIIQSIAPWDHLDLGQLANKLISDPFYSFYPRRLFLTESLHSGTFPLWNPGIMTGTPAVANPNFQLFYPPNLLAALLLPAHHALPWLAWFHLTLTGALMYLLLQRHRLHWLACTLGGVLWLLNGSIMVWMENPHRLSTLAWMPGIFWAYEAATQENSIGRAALGGLFLGLAILGGQMQFVFAIGLMLGLYGVIKLVLTFRQAGHWPVRPLLYLVIIGVIGLGIGALILLPAADFAEVSQRSRLTAATIQQTRWPLSQIVTFISANFYGNPTEAVDYWGVANYAEMTAYFGVVALLLALTAPFVKPRKPFIYYALSLALASILILLGTPVVRLLLLLPGSQFIPLGRMLFLFPFAGTLLAAAGLDGWLGIAKEPDRRSRYGALVLALIIMVIVAVTTVIGLGDQFQPHRTSIVHELGRSAVFVAAAVALLLLLKRNHRLAGLAILALALVELFFWGKGFNPIISTEYLYPENELTQWLQQDTSLHRVLPLQSGKVVFGPNVLTVFGQQEIGGYTPLIQERYRDLFKAIDDTVDIPWMASNRNMLVMSDFDPMVSLLNVKYVLSKTPLQGEMVLQVAQEGCDSPAELGETAITGSFVAQDPGLNRIDLTFVEAAGSTGVPAGGSIQFQLRRGASDGDLIAEITREVGELSPGSPEPFFFAPVADSAGQLFVWEITGLPNLSLCQMADGSQQFAAYATWLRPLGTMAGVQVYENPNVLPRAFVVHHVVQSPSGQVIETMQDPEFNYYLSAVVEDNLPDSQQELLAETPFATKSRAIVTNYSPLNIDVAVEGSDAGFLVLSDAYFQGWSATIDGEPTPIYRTDQALRGVFIPSGSHTVHFRYRPPTLTPALALSGLALLSAALLISRELIKGRSGRTNKQSGDISTITDNNE
jgi:hypothetical protein